ncbi:MAG: cell division protein ZapA [Oscillospiraceae bacterium]|nr:cell division protein ZapA [Oscillospiraceae bacterium]
MDKSKMTVRIAGHEYSIVSTDDPEHVQRVARYVDRRMSDLAAASRLPAPMVSVMTAMNIAEEMLRAQDENVRLRQELSRIKAQTESK